jgi:hypothetical protein
MLLLPPLRSGEAADCVPDLDGDGDAPFPGAASVRELVLARDVSGIFSFAIWKSLGADDGQSSALNKVPSVLNLPPYLDHTSQHIC